MFLAALPLIAIAAAMSVSARPFSSRTASASAPGLGNWYHDSDHSVYNLFRRERRRDDPMPSVGSPEWIAQYPSSTPSTSDLPQAWVDALNNAVNAGRIPNIPPSTSSNGAAPVYPSGFQENRDTPSVCAWTDRVCQLPGNVYNAPDGYMGIGFDDGPTEFSPMLYDFLQKNSQRATHYMIGINILSNNQEFLMCYNGGFCDLAVHTWTHPMMTTLSNIDVMAQLAWTIQIIYDSTDGKIPRYWRPPSGDIDARVSAIAQEVFGLTAILWNQDTEDWTMLEPVPATNLTTIQSQMEQWLGGPKNPGLIILEHELANSTIQAFINAWPLIAQNNWKPVSQAILASNDTGAYSDNDSDDDSDDDDVYQDGSESDGAFNSLLVTSSESTSASSASASATLESAQSSSTGAPSGTKKSGGMRRAQSLCSLLVSCILISSLPLVL